MFARQTVFLSEDRKRAVPEGDKAARFLLVRQGQEIPDAITKRYEGAAELIQSEPSSQAPAPPVESDDKKPAKKNGKE